MLLYRGGFRHNFIKYCRRDLQIGYDEACNEASHGSLQPVLKIKGQSKKNYQVMATVKQTPPCSPAALPTPLQPSLPPRSSAYHPAAMQAPLVVSIAGREPRVAFHIGESSGKDDDDPNVATGDDRAPPQGSTTPRWWNTSDGGRAGRQGLQGCRVVSVLLSP